MPPTVQDIQAAMRYAWQIGRLKYKLLPPQITAYDQFYRKRPSRKFVMVAGRRCRKSTLLLILHAECCIRTAGVQTAYVAPVETGLADYIEPIIGVVFADCPVDLLPKFRDRTLVFPNGSRVVFNGCNMRQYRYMRGQKLALATVDEMAEVDDLEGAVDDVLFPAVWDSHGEMVLSGTPPVVPSPDHPVMRYVETAKQTDSYWHATVYDAGYSESEIAEAMREVGIDGKDSARFKREFMAEFIRDESAVIVPEFNADLHVRSVPRPVYYSDLYKASGADLGVSDKTVALFAYYDFPKSQIVIQREFALSGTDVRTDIFADRYRAAVRELGWDVNTSRTQHWSDNSNLMLLNDLSQLHDIHINPTDKEQKAEWLNKVRIMLGSGRILVDPSCKLLIATLHGAFWKDALKKDYGRSMALGHMDALDALIYMVRNIRTEINPFPFNYNFATGTIYDAKDVIYPPDWNTRAHTQEGRTLERVFGKERFNRQRRDSMPMGGL
jgi:hypothetical protein